MESKGNKIELKDKNYNNNIEQNNFNKENSNISNDKGQDNDENKNNIKNKEISSDYIKNEEKEESNGKGNNITLNNNSNIIFEENKSESNLVNLREKEAIDTNNIFDTFNNNVNNIEQKIKKINGSFINQNQLPELRTIINPQILNKSHSNFFTSDDIQVGEK